jgi:phosphoribosylanthranilate isomerase
VFQIKICGITRPADARLAAQAGADAIGLNFYPPSPRSLTWEQAEEICQQISGSLQRIGVFVNQGEDEIRHCVESLQLDAVQLHGDEPAELIKALHPIPVIRAFRCQEPGLAEVRKSLDALGKIEAIPSAVLLDAHLPGQYGGTGRVLDWQQLDPVDGTIDGWPFILSGGLTPKNVGTAIRQARPWAVDTASGVESKPGHKDPELLRRFVAEAQAAMAALSG